MRPAGRAWRFAIANVQLDDPSKVSPHVVAWSCHQAGRLLDAKNHVDKLPLPPTVREGLQACAVTGLARNFIAHNTQAFDMREA